MEFAGGEGILISPIHYKDTKESQKAWVEFARKYH